MLRLPQWRHRWGTPEESPAAPRSRVPTPHDTAWVCSSLEPCLTLAITLATSKGLSMSSDLLMRVHERSAYRCRGSLRDGGSQVLLTTAKFCFASGMFHGCDRSSTANMFTEKTTKCQTCQIVSLLTVSILVSYVPLVLQCKHCSPFRFEFSNGQQAGTVHRSKSWLCFVAGKAVCQ